VAGHGGEAARGDGRAHPRVRHRSSDKEGRVLDGRPPEIRTVVLAPPRRLPQQSLKIWRIELVFGFGRSKDLVPYARTLWSSGAGRGEGDVSVTTSCSRFAAARFSQAC